MVEMLNFQDIFDACKRSFISDFSIWMTVSTGLLIVQLDFPCSRINK